MLSKDNYTLRVFYNSQDFLTFLDTSRCKKATFILSQISAGVLDEDIHKLVSERIPSHDYSVIVFSNSENYLFTENFRKIANGGSFSMMKKDFISNPEKLISLLNKIK
jgi:hypothetical protein